MNSVAHMVTADVRLGKCQEMSPCLHVMPSLDHAFGVPLCNQGNVKHTVGAVPTRISFPAEGDVSQVRVEEGPVCSKCLKTLQRKGVGSNPTPDGGGKKSVRNATEASAGSAPTGAATGRETQSRAASNEIPHLKHKRSLLVELKDQLLTGEIRYPAYIKKALPLQKEIQTMEAGAK